MFKKTDDNNMDDLIPSDEIFFEVIPKEDIACMVLIACCHFSIIEAENDVLNLCQSHGLEVKLELLDSTKYKLTKEFKKLFKKLKPGDSIIINESLYRKSSQEAKQIAIEAFYSFLEDEDGFECWL